MKFYQKRHVTLKVDKEDMAEEEFLQMQITCVCQIYLNYSVTIY